VRGFFNLTDNPDSVMILREDQDDRQPRPASRWPGRHPGHHRHPAAVARGVAPGDEPRYCLISRGESGPELDAYVSKLNPQTKAESRPLDPEFAARAYDEVAARKAARAAARAAANGGMDSPMEEVKSEPDPHHHRGPLRSCAAAFVIACGRLLDSHIASPGPANEEHPHE